MTQPPEDTRPHSRVQVRVIDTTEIDPTDPAGSWRDATPREAQPDVLSVDTGAGNELRAEQIEVALDRDGTALYPVAPDPAGQRRPRRHQGKWIAADQPDLDPQDQAMETTEFSTHSPHSGAPITERQAKRAALEPTKSRSPGFLSRLNEGRAAAGLRRLLSARGRPEATYLEEQQPEETNEQFAKRKLGPEAAGRTITKARRRQRKRRANEKQTD